jgi:hypothetical protein
MSNQSRRNIAALVGAAGTILMAATILTALHGADDIFTQIGAAVAGMPALALTFVLVTRIHTEEA